MIRIKLLKTRTLGHQSQCSSPSQVLQLQPTLIPAAAYVVNAIQSNLLTSSKGGSHAMPDIVSDDDSLPGLIDDSDDDSLHDSDILD